MSVSLVVIFNHRYDQNIEKLNTLFEGRFDSIRYLAPFTKISSPRVTKVYGSSTAFSSHIAQAHTCYQKDAASHHLFIGDDLFLNPSINQDNILNFLGAGADDAYIKNVARIENSYYLWIYLNRVVHSFRSSGFDFRRELPSSETVAQRLLDLGLPPKQLGVECFRHWNGYFNFKDMWANPKFVLEGIRSCFRSLPYPLVFGYSDLILVPAVALPKFVEYCGVFGAMNLFAEVAVPTALVLSCDSIKTEQKIGNVFQKGDRRQQGQANHGLELWGEDTICNFESAHNRKLKTLEASFPADRLYVHPVKLSRWS